MLYVANNLEVFSPHSRRCFSGGGKNRAFIGVFSAYSEVFPCKALPLRLKKSFLRADGGVSAYEADAIETAPFSPRMRRCFWLFLPLSLSAFVFSAYAEVFPSDRTAKRSTPCVLRICGGVLLTTCFRLFFPSIYKFLYTLKTFLKLFLILPVLNSV